MSLIPFFNGALGAYNRRMALQRETEAAEQLERQQTKTARGDAILQAMLDGKLNLDNPKMKDILKEYDLEEFAELSIKMKKEKTPHVKIGTSGNYDLPLDMQLGDYEATVESLRHFNTYIINNPDYLPKIHALGPDSIEYKSMKSFLSTLKARVNNFHHAESSYNKDGTFRQDVFKDYYRDGQAATAAAFYKFGVAKSPKFREVPQVINNPSQNEPDIQVPTQAINSDYMTMYDVNSTDSFIPVLYSTLAEQVYGDANQVAQIKSDLNALATHHGFDDANHMGMNIDMLVYPDKGDTTQVDITNGARLKVAGVQNLSRLDGALSGSAMQTITRMLTTMGRGTREKGYSDEDRGAMRRAVYTTIKLDAINIGLPTHMATGITGEMYAQQRKVNTQEFFNQAAAAREADIGVRELMTLQENFNRTGLAELATRAGIGILDQYRQLTDMFSDENELTINLTEDTNAATLMNTARKTLQLDVEETIGVMDSLKIALAAKMARAVDPAGRLSNQDFEMQLQRLGVKGSFDTRNGRLASLRTVQAEFARKAEDMAFMESVYLKDEITPEDMRFIEADKVVTNVIRHRRKVQGRYTRIKSEGPADGKPPETLTREQVLENIKNGKYAPVKNPEGTGIGYYIDPDTNTRYNLDGTVRYMETQ